MDLKSAFKEQYHASLAMLVECVEKCPEDLWLAPASNPAGSEQVVLCRTFWRIAFHTAFYAHLYLGQTEADFKPWPGRRQGIHSCLWEEPANMEPYELPDGAESYSRREMLDYIAFVDSLVDPTVDGLDMDSEQTGFSWYPNMSKLSHELLSLRHIQGHVGQLSELLMARGIDTDWISRCRT